MSLLRSLLLLVVVVCAAPLCAAEWPCPNAADITPCVCTATADYKITMDCSSIASSDQLAIVFQTPFAFNDLQRLVIQPTDPFSSLVDLPAGVFDEKTFVEIDITNTFIHTVEEQALANSHGTLVRLNLAGNEISSFPSETLYLFTALREFDISYNKLSGLLPDIESATLLTLDMSFNTGLMFAETTFVGLAILEEMRMSGLALGATAPANAFLTLKYLRTLYLDSNGLSGTLIEGFINPDLNPLLTVQLNGNQISAIHPLSVTGMKSEGKIYFRNNLIEYLPREEWEGLVSDLTTTNAIDVRDNPLVCGCDVMWLVFDSLLMSRFHNGTTCVTGNLMYELPEQWFLDHCP